MSTNTYAAAFAEPKHSILRAYDLSNNKILSTIEVDCVLSEKLSFKKDVTRFPVEEGPDATDNAVVKPIEVSVDCIVSESPVEFSDYAVRLNALSDNNAENVYVAAAKEFCAICMQANILLEIEISLGLFRNLSVSSIDFAADAATIGSLKFSMTFSEITFVRSQIDDLPDFGEYKPTGYWLDKVNKGKKKKGAGNPPKPPSNGEKVPKEVKEAMEKVKGQSAWAVVIEWIAKIISGW